MGHFSSHLSYAVKLGSYLMLSFAVVTPQAAVTMIGNGKGPIRYQSTNSSHQSQNSNASTNEAIDYADAEFHNDVYSKSVAKLSEHLALRTACPRLEKNGEHDLSTGIWYLGDSLRSWSRTYLEQFPDQVEFPDRAFEKSFIRIIKEKHGHFLFAPKSAEDLAKAFTQYLKDEHAKLRNAAEVPGSAREFLRSRGKDPNMSAVFAALKAFNNANQERLSSDRKALENCRALRADYRFWETPSFDPSEKDLSVGRDQESLGGDREGFFKRNIVNPISNVAKKVTGRGDSQASAPRSNESQQNRGASQRPSTDQRQQGASHGGGNAKIPTEEQEEAPKAAALNLTKPDKPSSKPPEKSKAVQTNLPAVSDDEMRSKGYYRFGAGDGHTYGTARTIWRIQEAGKILAKKGIVMGIGEISKKGGKTPGHKEHQKGNDIDMRMIMKDGIAAPSNTYGANSKPPKRKYDLQKTFLAMKAMIDVDPYEIEKVFIEDAGLRKMITDYMWNTYKRRITATGCNHYDHIHISYKDN